MQAVRSRKIYLVALVGGLLCLTAATLSAQQVTYNFMPGTDFSKYHTYKWVDIPSNVHPNQIVAQKIGDAVNNVLATKGFTLATGDKAANTAILYGLCQTTTDIPLVASGILMRDVRMVPGPNCT